MKKKIYFIILTLLFVFTFPITIKADMGPKPNIKININNINENYYVDVLFENKKDLEDLNNPDYLDYLFSKKLNLEQNYEFVKNYIDNENYLSYSLYFKPNRINEVHKENNRTLSIGYRVPNNIKILIYSPIDNTVITSKKLDIKSFNAIINIDLNKIEPNFNNNTNELIKIENSFKIKETHNYIRIISIFFITLAVTIIIELAIFYLFKFKEIRSYNIVIVTNFITQVFLIILIMLTTYINGFLLGFFYFIFAELIILIIESIVYTTFIKEHSVFRKISYAIIANLITAALTLLPILSV